MKTEEKNWLVTTKNLEDGVWFREEEDFKVGMNLVAALAAISPISILAFILMSNHVHFVLFGKEADAKSFISELKRRYSMHLQQKYDIEKLLKRNDVDLRPIPYENDSLERAIAYVQMNCVAANICLQPTQYPWGSGSVFFSASPPKGIRLNSLSARERIRLTHTKAPLPGDWLIGNDGYVLPSSYVKVKYVERLFRTPSRMDYFLRNSSKAKLHLNAGQDAQPSFKDQTILAVLPELCQKLYGVSRFQQLTDPQRTEVLRQLRFRFSSNVHQLARVVGLSYDAAARLLDSQ